MFHFNSNNMKYLSCLFLFMMAFVGNCFAQQLSYATAKEKIYVQTDHVFYKPGETVYFKLYLVNARDQRPSNFSSIAYVEVITPSGTPLAKYNYRVENGYIEGSFDFPEQATGGVYKIKAYTSWMRNEKETTWFTKEITLQKVIAPRLLMKLEFPKKGYGGGDEVIADFSVRSLDDQPVRNKEAKYTVSVSGVVIQTSNFSTNQEGKAQLRFRLPKDLSSGDGLLNITLQHDGYVEAISRSIPIVLNKIDLQFMPEGGRLVNGLTTNVAFKAINEQGKPVDVKGDVTDDKGRKVTSIESYHFGMGKFSFTPEANRTYTVKISSPANITGSFKVPAAIQKGVVINMTDNKVRLLATQPIVVRLIGQVKGVNYFNETISLQKGEQEIPVNTGLFPAGIARFTVYTEQDQPLAERIVFLNKQKLLDVKITTDKDKYLPREKVTLHLKTLDEDGKPVPSNFSLSVIDDKLWSFADDKQDHIISWLMMSTELKGKIEEPAFCFKKEEPKAAGTLDLVMLTHGYRYFDYLPSIELDGKLLYAPDQQHTISGLVLNDKKEPVKATVYLIHSHGDKKAMEMITSGDGLFFFADVQPNTNYTLIAKSFNRNEKLSIKVDQNGIGSNPIAARQFGAQFNNMAPAVIPVAAKPIEQPELWPKDEKEKKLEEVVVVGFGVQQKKTMAGAIITIAKQDLAMNANMQEALAGKIAGVQVVQNANPGFGSRIMIRGANSLNGSNEPLWVVNGVVMDRIDLSTLNPNDIESVTVLKNSAASAIYGCMAANGVIIIESKKLNQKKISIDLTSQYYYATTQVTSATPSYAVARKFYAPLYQTTTTRERNDFRETIYWNPVVQTNAKGEATVEFYNSDATTTFRAIAEGIGYNGKVGRAEHTYAAQHAISADAKIPPYLTVGDKALIPLVIKNNRNVATDIHIALSLPEKIKTGSFDSRFVLPAGQAREVLIPIEATATVEGTIRFSVNEEVLALPVTASDKGFPVIETFSGNVSAQHTVNINKMIPGSLRTNLRLYTSLEGQLLDGIESMLREPSGCFEQTSSSTYPNIFILKYLRESGRSNEKIEKKAMGYIENGYKRLVGYETAENGFEWFGHTPPHVALTAYGLLEFTAMQEFLHVDKQMLARTKDFLLKRRDGKGTFRMSDGGYDRFASVPARIANIYVVYALTQAGIGKEIELEYKTALNSAIQNNDPYQLAMMAIAASNMKSENDYRVLMNTLRTINMDKAETSVVNSRDESLQIETLSLYALALMRDPSPRIGEVAGIISKVLGQKSYYGYGSTQATVLALEAIVAYSKLAGQRPDDFRLDFSLNGATVQPGAQHAFREGKNAFHAHFANEKETVPYNMEVAYFTFTPPNSEKAELKLDTRLKDTRTKVGETVRLDIQVTNDKSILQPMAIVKIGIPAGLATQPWQLKEIMEKKEAAYYEIFDNYLVLYWMGFAPNEVKKVSLDLKAEVPGTYKGKASNTYLYYTPEHKHWNEGLDVNILP
ncbi:TonB-dependent outer membrane receptor, SusC/RagA subfamily, signature region [Chitinophaga niabensis]|uniref:TonB-dependent outer membrane receptor, SusC/RagA subfamily, signature region n=2 Tax=Chitinophaga niabensis TaxID=536979 RepID=A0A1N6D5K0_9BACT|nr:TonB-dependent outer membrane receptor, SusC/RagA subfamily, signature region [Chitinophaga niabensis]